jgi:uncharacterized membrane protein
MTTQNGKVLKAAQQALKSGDKIRARQLLEQAARQDPSDHRPWLWLAGLAPSPRVSLVYIQRAETIRPGDPTIYKARRWAEARLVGRDGASVQPLGWHRVFAQRDLHWSLGLVVLLLVLVILAPNSWPSQTVRLLVGFGFVFYLPGYWLQTALFTHKDDLDDIERVGVSLGLSVAVAPFLAFILDKLPWGLHLWPMLVGECAVTLLFMGVTAWRRAHLATQAAYIPELHIRPRQWWRDLPPGDRRIYRFLFAALLLTGLATTWVFLVPSPDEFMTEFYMLGPEGLAENFPRQAAPGEILSVTAGLANKERDPMTYRVEMWAVDPWDDRREKVGESIPITLQPGESLEWPLSWSMPWPGDDQKVEFLLFNDQSDQAYRQLRLWLNVTDQ